MTLGERIVVFNGGRIEQVGSPHELYNHPGNLFVAGFLGAPKMNFIACDAVACGPGTVAVRLPGGAVIEVEAGGERVAPGDRLTLGVRAEHVGLHDGGNTGGQAGDNVVDAAVSHVEYLGDVAIVYASMPGVAEMLAVKLPAQEALRQPGAPMRLYLPPRHCLLFDVSGQALPRTVAAPAQPFM
ncbi:MAG: TOBE domain-containing protein, partial [Janthinobacterium sp.]